MILLQSALRGIWRGRRSYIACILLMALGIAVYISFHLLERNLSAAMDDMYRQQRFAHAFASVRAMPQSHLATLAAIPGVREVGAKLTVDARAPKPDSAKIITLRLNSFDPEDAEPLNGALIKRGALPGEDGILIGEGFAEAHNIQLGDTITLVVGQVRTSPVVTGIALSPEYVYALSGSGQLLPDDEAFGFAFLPESRLEVLAGKPGFVTDLSFLLEDPDSFALVRPQLEDALAPYGLRSLVERKDQLSHSMLSQEIAGLASMATALPLVFIVMAVIILTITLKRVIEQERMQIGSLKAFGFSSGTILRQYMVYGLAAGTLGGLLGALIGNGITGGLTNLYLGLYRLPPAETSFSLFFYVMGFALSVASGVAGAYLGARSILKLSPVEAMRAAAPPPVKGRARTPFYYRLLASHGYMAMRNIGRNRFRCAFVVLGIAFSFSLTAFMASYGDMFDTMILNRFTKLELYNLKISLTAPSAYTSALEAVAAQRGVRLTEGILELPVELRNGNLKQDTALTALESASSLYRLYDSDTGRTAAPPDEGVTLSRTLADKLHASPGDDLTLKTSYTGEEEYAVQVVDVVQTNMGSAAYISLPALWRLVGIPPTVTGVLVDADDPAPVKEDLQNAENISAITDQEDSKEIYAKLLQSYASLILMMQLSGGVIAFAIIQNTSSISLSERKREYATMRVLGMYPREIGRVVSFEYWFLTLLAIPPGIALTRLLKQGMAGMIQNEMFSMPVNTPLASFATAAVICGAAVQLSNLSARRKIARFEMAEVLKERE